MFARPRKAGELVITRKRNSPRRAAHGTAGGLDNHRLVHGELMNPLDRIRASTNSLFPTHQKVSFSRKTFGRAENGGLESRRLWFYVRSLTGCDARGPFCSLVWRFSLSRTRSNLGVGWGGPPPALSAV